jgi:tetratricopeptide (TPR) repeat protein
LLPCRALIFFAAGQPCYNPVVGDVVEWEPGCEFARSTQLHATHYGRWLEVEGGWFAGDPAQAGKRHSLALHVLRHDLDNVRQWLHAALSTDADPPALSAIQHLAAGLELACDFVTLRDLCTELLDGLNPLDDGSLRLHVLLGLTTSLRRLGATAQAMEAAAEGLQVAEDLAEPGPRLSARRSVAQCLIATSRNEDARECLTQALDLASAEVDLLELAAILNILGTLDFRQGRQRLARERLTRAAEILRGLGNPDAEARTLGNLGLLEIREGNLQQAQSLFQTAFATAMALGNHREAAIHLANLGSIASDQGQLGEARVYYRQALDEIQQTGERSIQATLLGNLGMVAREEHEYMLAATLLGQAFEIHTALGNRLGQAEILRFMAIVSLLQQNPREAAVYLIRALEMSHEYGAGREVAVSAGLAGTLLARQGDLLRGATLLHAALHQEQLHNFRYEDDVRSILHDGLDEVSGAMTGLGLTGADKARARDAGENLDLAELGPFTARTLRERFAWHAVPNHS